MGKLNVSKQSTVQKQVFWTMAIGHANLKEEHCPETSVLDNGYWASQSRKKNRQTREDVWRSPTHVPAALFLGVLGASRDLLGTFLSVWDRMGSFLNVLARS